MARPDPHEKPIGWMGLGEGAITPIYQSDYDDEEEQRTTPEEPTIDGEWEWVSVSYSDTDDLDISEA